MIQFYLLSVVFNALTAIMLIGLNPVAKKEEDAVIEGANFYETKNFRLIVGIITVFTGLIKLLTVLDDDILIFGDILPALAGLLGGAILLYDFYLANSNVEVSMNPLIEKIIAHRKYIGIATLVIAFLHFLLPRALFL